MNDFYNRLPINEIFVSIDGEVNDWGTGALTVFIRTQGCNLRCFYCDTTQSWNKESEKNPTTKEIADLVLSSGVNKVTITGGEPLLHTLPLERLCLELNYYGINISIETNGTIPIPLRMSQYPLRISWIVDYKNHSRTSVDEFAKVFEYCAYGGGTYWIKFLIEDRADFIAAMEIIQCLPKIVKVPLRFALSPIQGKDPMDTVTADELLYWIVVEMKQKEYSQPISINTQLHKLIFPAGEKNHILL